MPAFWRYHPPPHDYPYYWVILDPKSKKDKVKVTNLKNSPKFQFVLISKQTLHVTHLIKLLEKMCKYHMDPTSIVEDSEQTRFCPQTDRQTDKVKPVYPPFNFVEAGYNHQGNWQVKKKQHCANWWYWQAQCCPRFHPVPPSLHPTYTFNWHLIGMVHGTYSISQEICTRFCCALLCCGYAIVHNEFTWSIYPYSSGLLCWHWGNR